MVKATPHDSTSERRICDVTPPAWRTRLTGKSVLLIDDVMTTGATAAAATRALRRGGAAQVDVLTFAIAIQEGL